MPQSNERPPAGEEKLTTAELGRSLLASADAMYFVLGLTVPEHAMNALTLVMARIICDQRKEDYSQDEIIDAIVKDLKLQILQQAWKPMPSTEKN